MKYLLPLLLLMSCVWDLDYNDVACTDDTNCPDGWHCDGGSCSEGGSPVFTADDDDATHDDHCCPGGETGADVYCENPAAMSCAIDDDFGCGTTWDESCAETYAGSCGANCD